MQHFIQLSGQVAKEQGSAEHNVDEVEVALIIQTHF